MQINMKMTVLKIQGLSRHIHLMPIVGAFCLFCSEMSLFWHACDLTYKLFAKHDILPQFFSQLCSHHFGEISIDQLYVFLCECLFRKSLSHENEKMCEGFTEVKLKGCLQYQSR